MPERHLSNLEDAIAHLGAALIQAAPTDDPIIMEHVRAAHELVRDAFRAAQPRCGGGLMANTIDRTAVMRRAWAIFRETYKYPSIPFKSIGRKCLAWAMRAAWAEAKEAARIAAIPADVKAARIATLQAAIEREYFNDHWQSASFRIENMRTEIRQLSA